MPHPTVASSGRSAAPPRTMRAARLVERGRLECTEAPVPTATDDTALVRTLVASICGSDFHVVDHAYYGKDRPSTLPGPPGFPGHESVVEVVVRHDTGDPAGPGPGELALAVPPANRSAAYAEYQVVPTASLVPVPRSATVAQLVLAQQLGTVLHATDTFWPRPLEGTTAVIVGAGSAGIMFCVELRRRGAARIVIGDPSPARLAVAGAAGADQLVDTRHDRVADAVMDLTGGLGAPLVIDASGEDGGRSSAIASLARDATFGMFGLPMRSGSSPFDLAALFERRGRLVASHSAQLEPGLRAFRAAVQRVAGGELDALGLLTHRFPLSSIDAAFATARARDAAIKVLVDVADDRV